LSKAQSVTSIEVSPEEERRSRFIKYTVAMIIRVVCVILAVLVPLGWLTVLFASGAIFLPYFAVVIANAQGNSFTSSKKTAEAPTISISAESFKAAKNKNEDDK
jgi:hypothetical protein